MIIKNAKVYSDGCRFVEKDLIIRDGRIVFGAARRRARMSLTRAVPMRCRVWWTSISTAQVGHDFCDADEAGPAGHR